MSEEETIEVIVDTFDPEKGPETIKISKEQWEQLSKKRGVKKKIRLVEDKYLKDANQK